MNEMAQLQKDPTNGQFLPGNYGSAGHLTLNDPEEISRKTDEYLLECKEQEMSATIPGLAYALGFSNRSGLYSAMDRMNDRSDMNDCRTAVAHTLKRAKLFIESQRVQRMVDGKGNVIGAIFSLKNNHGYIDKQVSESNIKVQQVSSPEDVQALKELALQMIEQRENDDTILIEAESADTGAAVA